MLAGCATRQQLIEGVQVRRVAVERVRIDSLTLHDSIYVRERGDTVWMVRWHTQVRDRVVHDSICVGDSVVKSIPVTKEVRVKNPLNTTLLFVALTALLLLVIKMGLLPRIKNIILRIIQLSKKLWKVAIA